MRKTVIEFPKKRLEELIKEEERVLNSINNVKNELDILEREYSIICARRNELESLLKYSTHDDNVLRDIAEKTSVANPNKLEEYQYTPDCNTGVMRKTAIVKTHDKAATYAELASQLSNKAYIGIDLAQGFDMPPENRKGVVK